MRKHFYKIKIKMQQQIIETKFPSLLKEKIRYPISLLKLNKLDENLFPKIDRVKSYHDQIIKPHDLSHSSHDQDYNLLKSEYALDGSIKRFKFHSQHTTPVKRNVRKIRPGQSKLECLELYNGVYLDQKIALDWFTNRTTTQRSQFSQQYLDAQDYVQNLNLSNNNLQTIKVKINPQCDRSELQIAPVPINRSPIMAKATSRYNLIQKPKEQDAIYKNNNSLIFIPSSILAPVMNDERRVNHLKEVMQLRDKYYQSSDRKTKPKHQENLMSQSKQQRNKLTHHQKRYLQQFKQNQLNSYIQNPPQPYIMINVKQNHMTQVIQRTNASFQGQITQKIEKIQVTQSCLVKPEICEIFSTSIADDEIDKVAIISEQKDKISRHHDRRIRRIQRWKQRRILQIEGEPLLSEIDEQSSQSSAESEESRNFENTEEFQKANQLKQEFAEIKKCKKHLEIIKKLHMMTKRIEIAHVRSQQSKSSSDKVIDFQAQLIKSLTSKKVSRQSINRLQMDFFSIIKNVE